MNWFSDLFFGEGVAHSILMLAVVIATGIALGKIKIKGISLGVTWILFAGIAFAHFGKRIDTGVLHILQEFGLILFVFSIGMQVGPGFFVSISYGALTLTLLSACIVLLRVDVTCITTLVT